MTRALLALTAGAVISGCALVRGPDSAGGYVDDAAITSKVRSELAADKSIDSASITVETSAGTVLLSGFARSPLEKQTAEGIALKTQGVSRVRNEIALRP